MKKIISAVLLFAVLLSFTACGAKEFDVDKLQQIANESTNQLVKGEFEAVTKKLSAQAKKTLTKDTLQSAWNGIVSQMGTFLKIERTDIATTEKTAELMDTCSFENGSATVSYTFNDKYEIHGLWVDYAEPPEDVVENEDYSEIPIKVGYDENKMEGLLTLPKNVEKPPVVILVQGSGQYDRDYTFGGAENKPFRDLAQGLALQGIATIRYDKRFYTFVDLKYEMATTLTVEDEVLKDVTAAIALAKADVRLDASKIFVLGHNMGGMLSPSIATENKDVAGIISMSGTLRRVEDIMLTQREEALNLDELMSKEGKEEALNQSKADVKAIKAITSPEDAPVLGQPASYWLSLNKIDSVALVKKLTLPILVLQGGADYQISPTIDYKLWQDTLAGRTNATFHLYEGLNHLLMPTAGARDASEYEEESQVEQVVIDDISAWVLAN